MEQVEYNNIINLKLVLYIMLMLNFKSFREGTFVSFPLHNKFTYRPGAFLHYHCVTSMLLYRMIFRIVVPLISHAFRKPSFLIKCLRRVHIDSYDFYLGISEL